MLGHHTQAASYPQDGQTASKKQINEKLNLLGYLGFFAASGLVLGTWRNFITPLSTLKALVEFPGQLQIDHRALANITINLAPGMVLNNTLSPVEERATALGMTAIKLIAVNISTFFFVTSVALFCTHFLTHTAYVETYERKSSIPDNKLSKRSLRRRLKKQKITAGQLAELNETYEPNAVEQYFRDMGTFSSRAAGWASKISLLGFMAGSAFMLKEFYESDSSCKVPPPIGLLFCDYNEASALLFEEGYAWTAWIGSWFVSFAASMFGYHAYRLIQFLRDKPAITQKLNNPQTEAGGKFLYTRLLLRLGLIFSPAYLAYSAKAAWNYASYLAEKNQCPPVNEVFNNIMRANYNDNNPNNVCTSPEHLKVLAGFLTYLELGMIWSGALFLLAFSLLAGPSIKTIKKYYFKSEDNENSYAIKILKQTDDALEKAMYWFVPSLVVGGIIAFFPAEGLANNLAAYGVWQVASYYGIVVDVMVAPPCSTSANRELWNVALPGFKSSCDPVTLAQMCAGFVSCYWMWVPPSVAFFVGLSFYKNLLQFLNYLLFL